MSDDAREKARTAIEDAIYRALEAGMTADEIRAEVDYTLEETPE